MNDSPNVLYNAFGVKLFPIVTQGDALPLRGCADPLEYNAFGVKKR